MKEAYNIVMVSTGHGPLDDRIYYKEVLSLKKKYARIIIVTPEDKDAPAISEPGIEFVSLKRAGSLASRFLLVFKAFVVVMRLRPDVCHFHDFELIFAMPLLCLFSKCRIIYDDHEVYPEKALETKKVPRMFRPFFSRVVKISERVLSRCIHHIITPVENLSERFSRFHGNVTTIFNYPRRDLFIPDENQMAELRRRYRNQIPIIYQGGISEDRGLFSMLDAMKILRHHNPPIILLLVGPISESLLAETKRRIRTMEIQNNVAIVGTVPHSEVVNYISISKVGLVPLLPTKRFKKAIPIKQFEYMACGVPVLASNLPLVASYINAAGCGKVVEYPSGEALASGVLDILSDDERWKMMSEAGKTAVRDLWSWEQMEKKLFTVYDKLLGTV